MLSKPIKKKYYAGVSILKNNILRFTNLQIQTIIDYFTKNLTIEFTDNSFDNLLETEINKEVEKISSETKDVKSLPKTEVSISAKSILKEPETVKNTKTAKYISDNMSGFDTVTIINKKDKTLPKPYINYPGFDMKPSIYKIHMAICFGCWKLIKIDDIQPKKSFHFTRRRYVDHLKKPELESNRIWEAVRKDNTSENKKFLAKNVPTYAQNLSKRFYHYSPKS
ncbi:3407_t:CDS:2 [Cetraspora pellucida]|uniref:3407_t:CDS:1 n=1 Tax=Cetraspora pellucida TaxID=1433469 RepID=A0A9N8WJQ9_9GLOM|nr:3407_t:CDS:2 [Cetraspora pellucida]